MSRRIEEQRIQAKNIELLNQQKALEQTTKKRLFIKELNQQKANHSIASNKELVKNRHTDDAKNRQSHLKSEKKPPQFKLLSSDEKNDKNLQHDKSRAGKKDPKENKHKKIESKNEKESGEFNHKEADTFFYQAAHFGTGLIKTAQGTNAPTITREVLDYLVKNIYACVHENEKKEVFIDLNHGILSGARICLSSKDGKINLKFLNTNAKAKFLLLKSKATLKSRLLEKNILVSEFDVH